MDYRRPPSGVSPIIATLLLIAITVAAGVIVYVFVSGTVGNLTQGGGQQTAQQIELTSYAFSTSSGTTCGSLTGVTADGTCIVISFKNTGGSSATIDSIYVNGQALTLEGAQSGCSTLTVDSDCAGLGLASTGTGGTGYTGAPTGIVGGSTNTVKIVTATGGLFSFTITAGSSQ
jgi:flagellin-like protein